VLECVVNVSEGRDEDLLVRLADAADVALLDVHADPFHNRSVFTLSSPSQDLLQSTARALASRAVELLDVTGHAGVHPRLGVVDVVPFVPFSDAGSLEEALAMRAEFVEWFGGLGVPCFEYGPERSLPEVRRRAFRDLAPSAGPSEPHPTAGACCVGARPVLVAYNVLLDAPPELARAIASELRSPIVRALGFDLGGAGQVSFNLISPYELGPAEAYDLVAGRAPVVAAELVGLVPRALLDRVPATRWPELDLSVDRTIESRLAEHPATGA
jgi:glutamate formiminotransferase / 5-formyltetrahydrofolate cyclo-ligase